MKRTSVEQANPDLKKITFKKVAELFSGFDARLEVMAQRGRNENMTGFGLVRGGFKRDKTPFLSPDRIVEMSFTPEERVFVSASFARLFFLMNGWVYPDQTKKILSYEEKIKRQFRKQPNDDLSFVEAMTSASSFYVNKYGRHHRNLTPALRAGLIIAGVGGMATAISHSYNFLDRINNGLSKDDQAAELKRFSDHGNFVADHKFEGSPSEIHCLGRMVGVDMMRQAMRAAIGLSEDQKLLAKYSSEKDLTYSINRDIPKIYEVVNRLRDDMTPFFNSFK